MPIPRLSRKGQTTIPRDIRERLGLVPGDRLYFTLLPNGTVVMRAKKRPLAALAGLLHVPGRRPVSLPRMTEAVVDAAANRARASGTRRSRPRGR